MFFEILKNISYSIIAATTMAFFIDYNTLKEDIKEKNKLKERYFKEINTTFSFIAGHLLWFEQHLEDEFINWDLDPEIYLKIEYKLYSIDFNNPYEISFNEAVERLNEIGDKYTKDKLKIMSRNKVNRINKIFKIASLELEVLFIKMNKLNEDKLILDINDYMDIDEARNVLWNIKLCKALMAKNTSYHVATQLLISSMETIRNAGKFSNNIKVSLSEGFDFDILI